MTHYDSCLAFLKQWNFLHDLLAWLWLLYRYNQYNPPWHVWTLKNACSESFAGFSSNLPVWQQGYECKICTQTVISNVYNCVLCNELYIKAGVTWKTLVDLMMKWIKGKQECESPRTSKRASAKKRLPECMKVCSLLNSLPLDKKNTILCKTLCTKVTLSQT